AAQPTPPGFCPAAPLRSPAKPRRAEHHLLAAQPTWPRFCLAALLRLPARYCWLIPVTPAMHRRVPRPHATLPRATSRLAPTRYVRCRLWRPHRQNALLSGPRSDSGAVRVPVLREQRPPPCPAISKPSAAAAKPPCRGQGTSRSQVHAASGATCTAATGHPHVPIACDL